MDDRVVPNTIRYVQGEMADDSSGHDWWHVERVRRLALRLAELEGADVRTVELAALLHDIADYKFHGGDEGKGARVAAEWLRSQHEDARVIDHVADIISTMSFKGAGVRSPMKTVEGMVVQDADRLDALGAIGIARAFAYAGHTGEPLHDPELPARPHQTKDEYLNRQGTAINHFYEKLLILKDRMNTASARDIARRRHAFMEAFLKEFHAEWDEMI